MKVQFKFRDKTSGKERQRLLERLEREADQVERLFPEEHADELATLYVARLADERLAKALRLLRRSKAVEFAEPEVSRRLYLPEELKGRKAISER